MSNGITRRELLGLALASPMAAALSFKGVAREGEGEGLDRSLVANSPGRVVGEGGAEDAAQVKLMREWRGPICRSRVVNRGREGVRLKEVVLFDIAHHLPPETRLYGEGFQMLSQNLSRNWQNGRLWWNDPDAVVLTGDLPAEEFQFHATAVYASGRMLLSGDDLTKIPAERLSMLKKLLPPTRAAADFEDDSLRVGVVTRPGPARTVCLFNWTDAPQSITLRLPAACQISDYWSGEDLGRHEGFFTSKDIPSHSACLLVCA